ncbi:family 43 glycosylhydrolase [Glycomyces buryatensis]|uniref:Alpha-N-arabinofuranosidase n=1 Tax=Glycomyces buryatensis TaxID=2570927 RepID=A0A4S8PXN3_9ACTN|nr:family 43 glycosylhydrolase [Glycomyces buryatensis]THV34702.1 alpha-N-arabinofuranosidase [Glycomyces buryatensis]
MLQTTRRRWRTFIALALTTALAALGLVAATQAPAQAAVNTGTWYVITSAHSGLALDIKGASTTAGAELTQWNRTDATNQQFRFIDAGGGYYRIQVRHSSMVLDVYEWNAENGATIAQWTDLGGTNQQWSVTEHSDGTYSFINRFSGKALDLWERSTTAGARISQYTYNAGIAQKWRLNAVGDGTQTTLANPIRNNGADPWIEYHDGYYYMSTTTWNSTVIMRRATTLAGLKTASDTVVWNDANTPSRCCSHWAPEFHRINGTWYLMYTSGNSQTNLDGQKLHVLRSTSSTPMGPYEFMGTPLPNQWNIDGTYLEVNGGLYLMWSEWVGADQSIRIAAMSNPWTVTGSHATISRPSASWETVGARVNEAPAVLQHDGRTFVTFSASSCNTPDYKLGLLELTGSNPLAASSWTKKSTPVFQQGNGVYGPAHNGFFTSPDGTEHWLVYHGNTSSSQGCGNTRQTRVQEFTFNADGTPNFGSPIANGVQFPAPSGE